MSLAALAGGPTLTLVAGHAVTILAQDEPSSPRGPEFGKASPIGLPIIILLLLATALLVWNMNKHIKRLPASFDLDHPEPDQAADEGTDAAALRVDADDDAGETGDAGPAGAGGSRP